MVWNGYFTLDEVEIINASRTESYAGNQPWFRAAYDNDVLRHLLDEEYDDVTTAPWYDPDVPFSDEFYGVYPLGVTGLDDSTATSTVVESTLDGGNVGRLRNATRPVVFSLVILAASERGAEYGMRWLRRALNNICGPLKPGCTGGTLSFLSSPPVLKPAPTPGPVEVEARLDGGTAAGDVDFPVLSGGDADFTGDHGFDGGTASSTYPPLTPPLPAPFAEQPPPPYDRLGNLGQYIRHLYRFQVNNGPQVTSQRTLTCGAAIWTVSMTGVAGDPAQYGAPVPLFVGFGDPEVLDPVVPGTGGTVDQEGFARSEVPCAVPVYDPIYDPSCPAVVPPPGPPDIALGCFDVPVMWWRRTMTIDKAQIPYWGEMVPYVSLRTVEEGVVSSVRLRFYPDRDDSHTITDQCDFEADLVVTYLPPGQNLVIDGVNRAVYTLDVTTGARRRADSLVVTTDGKPFEWPALSCGYGYIVTVDTLVGEDSPIIDLSLVPRIT